MQHRRTCLALVLWPILGPVGAWAQVVNVTAAQLKAMRIDPQGVVLDLPALADSGASVPLQAQIDAPAGLTIALIEVFLPENPNSLAVRLRLVEPQASYVFSTRLRLAGSQDAWVVATLSNGSRIGASAHTVVTASACFDGS